MKKVATNIMKNPGRTFEIEAIIGNPAVSESSKAVLSTAADLSSIYLNNEGL